MGTGVNLFFYLCGMENINIFDKEPRSDLRRTAFLEKYLASGLPKCIKFPLKNKSGLDKMFNKYPPKLSLEQFLMKELIDSIAKIDMEY